MIQMAQSTDLMVEIEQELMENIAKRLEMLGDLESPTYTIEWQQQKLREVNQLKRMNIEDIKRLTPKALNAVTSDITEAGVNAIEAIEPDFLTAISAGEQLKTVLPAAKDPTLKAIIDSFDNIGQTQAKLIIENINVSSVQVYIDSINKTVLQVNLGISTPDQALRQTMREWSAKGLPAFVDKAGRTWTAESYYNNVLRTTIRNVTTDMQFERMRQYGVDLMEISSHLGARPGCEPYQGKIYSQSGEHEKYPPLSSTTFGEASGLFGNNCKHQGYPFFEGINTTTFKPQDDKRNDKNYDNSQTQRKLERDIKGAKRQKAVYKANGDPIGVKQSNELLQGRTKRLNTFLDDTGRTRRSNRERIYSVDDNAKVIKKQNTKTKQQLKKVNKENDSKPFKKWIVSESDEPVTSFNTKKEAVDFGRKQRQQGRQVFVTEKGFFNDFRTKGKEKLK